MKYEKTEWKYLNKEVERINPKFAKLINDLSPGLNYPLFIFSYDYGELIGDEYGVFIPSAHYNEKIRLGENLTPSELLMELGYGSATSPLGMVLNKCFEWFYTTSAGETYPAHLDKPGSFFSIGHTLKLSHNKCYLPNGVLSLIAGAKSTFLLPKIGNAVKHTNLQKRYNISSPCPKDYSQHWKIFSDLSKFNRLTTTKWEAKIVYFSKRWLESIMNDPDWREVRDYFYELAITRDAYAVNSDLYNHLFRAVNKENKYTQNMYLYETCRYVIEIMLGEKLGYAPAINEDVVPKDLINEAYIEGYKLEHPPIIMVPSLFDEKKEPVYYSLNYPTIDVEKNASLNYQTILTNLPKIKGILLDTYQRNFSKPIIECKGTILEELSKNTSFGFYHSTSNNSGTAHPPSQLPQLDDRFPSQGLCVRAPFFQGCISIS